jgi:putative ATPase
MSDLFGHAGRELAERESPLAARMRPRTLDEFVGQDHVLGPGRLLRRAIQADQISSVVFYGPPGTGKTTLARVIANTTHSQFVTLNAVLDGVAQVREVVKAAQERRDLYGRRTILFVDEVHRWNKAQQDALLPWVENGTIIMVGATTENPWFSVNRALLSRSRVFQLTPLGPDALRAIALAALEDQDRGYGRLDVRLADDALEHLVHVSSGDARSLLNALELAVETTLPTADGAIAIDMAVAEESIQQRAVLYDREGDYHFDTISAFIKSLRGSDPDAALYWLAKMVYAGEDPRFIFRRMLISAGEDVGLADPQALVVVQAAAEALERVGLPEGQFHLATAALYLATCEKSNTVMGYFDALEAVKSERRDEVPRHLKDASRDKEGFGHGEGYLYPHAYRDHWVAQQYLPDALQGKVFYHPSAQGYERSIRDQVARRREAQLEAMVAGSGGDILTFTPADSVQERWLARVIDDAARDLGQIRDEIMARATIQRHDRVLDLNAGAGLLVWEALRRAPEGGVWTLAADPEAGAALAQIAERLPEVERPVVLRGSSLALAELVQQTGDADLRFDVVIGRNGLLALPDKLAGIAALEPLLAERCRLSLCETAAYDGQRLYQLCDVSTLGADLAARLAQAEETIYSAPDDPLVNWRPGQLMAALGELGFEIETGERVIISERLITAQQVGRWFTVGQVRTSYGQRLRSHLSAEEVGRVEALYRRHLAGSTLPWAWRAVYLWGQR